MQGYREVTGGADVVVQVRGGSQFQEQELAGPGPNFQPHLGLHTGIRFKEKDTDLGFLNCRIREGLPFPCYMQMQAFNPESYTHEKICEKEVQSKDTLDNKK